MWKTNFREAYVAKRRSKAAREGEEKHFGSSTIFSAAAEKTTHTQLRRSGNKTTAGPDLLTNQMMDFLEVYLDNIAASTTKTAAKGGPLAELAASLEISVYTVARNQQEIKRLYKQVNALKKRGTQASRAGTLPVGNNICTHCEAVGRTDPHKKNACYFDPKKMTDRKEWDRKLMDEKGVTCKDSEWQWGTVQTVINKYPIK